METIYPTDPLTEDEDMSSDLLKTCCRKGKVWLVEMATEAVVDETHHGCGQCRA